MPMVREGWGSLKRATDTEARRVSTATAISGIRVALAPYLPWTAARLGDMLGIGPEIRGWERPEVPGGTRLGAISPLFAKLEPDALDD